MDLRVASPTYDRVVGNLENVFSEFLETGFATFEMPDKPDKPDNAKDWRGYWRAVDKQWPIGPCFHRKIVRRTAKELKRPLVIVERHWGISLRVTVRKAAVRVPLVAQFLLLLADGTPRWEQVKRGMSVTASQDKTNWYLFFDKGRKGERAFEEWKKYVLSDGTCRAALKLPPLEAPELKHAA